jgi:hypothetical protein
MKTLTACALMLAVFAVSASGADARTGKKKKGIYRDHYVSQNHKRPRVRGYIARGGGYAYGYEFPTMLDKLGPYGNYPNFDDRSFWERVQSDPLNTRPGASGL